MLVYMLYIFRATHLKNLGFKTIVSHEIWPSQESTIQSFYYSDVLHACIISCVIFFAYALHVILFYALHSLHIDMQVVELVPWEGQDYDEVIKEYYEEDPEDPTNFVVDPNLNQGKPRCRTYDFMQLNLEIIVWLCIKGMSWLKSTNINTLPYLRVLLVWHDRVVCNAIGLSVEDEWCAISHET